MFFNPHNHTELGSNIRLIDAICKPKELIDYAIELGLSGIAVTEHESVSSAIEVNQYTKKIREKHPDFTVALGNEIYLTETREKKQKYFHFILLAKDAIGHKALRILSSKAWLNSYYSRGMARVPTLKSELQEILKNPIYKGHVIGLSACLGGELPTLLVQSQDNNEEIQNKIYNFITYCLDIFGEDFYFECQPAETKEQIYVNQKLAELSHQYGIKLVCSTDTHYLKESDRAIHKAYLNSKDGEREVDSFYRWTYLMSEDEAKLHLAKGLPENIIEEIFNNSEEIRQKIQFYDLARPQIIPKVKVAQYPIFSPIDNSYPTLNGLFLSNNEQERCWVNECWNGLREKNLTDNKEYIQRLETEASVIKSIGLKLNDCLFCYFNTFKHYIDLFWECGSIVGPGRGSSTGFLSNYLLGLTQLDPIKWGLQWWRFLNEGRAVLPDIDTDLDPVIRPLIFEKIREERGEFGLVQVCTYGTEATKSAILAACRGYHSEEYPDGIDVSIAQYLSSLVPQERGFLWKLDEVVHGNPSKKRKPVSSFVNEVKKYPGLLEIMMGIEGVHNKSSIHASGVILYGEDPYETAAFMRAPSGDIVTQYDLESAEIAGDTKYDFLVTEVTTKLRECLELLQEDKIIKKDSLRNIYNKYLHPDVIDVNNPIIWDHLEKGDILDVFQFSEGSGLAIAKKLKPKTPVEMTSANAIMRLMNEPGVESQADRFVRIKNNPKIFHKEMVDHHLPDEVIAAMHEYCDDYYGCVPMQEQMMLILMDKRIANFSISEADFARSVVAKKKLEKIPELQKLILEKISDKNVFNYIWNIAIRPSLGYAFSSNHSTPYSFVGIQTLELATRFNPIYWNTACLIVNSGSAKVGSGTTDYAKMAKAIGSIMNRGIKISLADINKSDFTFKPDAQNNQILYALKALVNVGDDLIQNIIENRPYTSLIDFINKIHPNRQAIISLIKGGAFDQFGPRMEIMVEYLWLACDKKKKITLQNMQGLKKYNLLPSGEKYDAAKRFYEFNRYLKSECKFNSEYYKLTNRAIDFLLEFGYEELIMPENQLKIKEWGKIYKYWMDIFREWMANNKESILRDLNTAIFMEDWNKYAKGNLSSWEMEALCFYYHDHELINVNNLKYGIVNFFSLPEEPIVDKIFRRGGSAIPIYKLFNVCGTCIAKNKTKSIVYLLTTEGVVPIKFSKEFFAMFDRQISQKNFDGTKTVIEKSWFNRGQMIIVKGIRRGDEFVAKKYASSNGHLLLHIDKVNTDGTLEVRSERYKGEMEDDEEV